MNIYCRLFWLANMDFIYWSLRSSSAVVGGKGIGVILDSFFQKTRKSGHLVQHPSNNLSINKKIISGNEKRTMYISGGF